MSLSKTSKILLFGANVWYFGEGLFGPLYAIFAEKVGGDILDITWAWATYLVITGLVYILVGKLVNGKSYKARVMVAGYALNALFTFGYLFVSNPWHLFIVQAGLGVAEAMGTPIWDSLYARHMKEEHDTWAWGLSNGQSQISTGIAVAIGGLIAYYVSFNALFIAMGCIQVMATFIQARILFHKNPE